MVAEFHACTGELSRFLVGKVLEELSHEEDT